MVVSIASVVTACGLSTAGNEAAPAVGPDGGTTRDAGAPGPDAGRGADGGERIDSGPGNDGGVTPIPDSGVPEAAPPVDAPPIDSGVDACGSLVENCENGVDDNCDGLIDCADPTCTAGYQCVAEAPPGWTGYFRYTTGKDPSSAPPCPDGSAATTLFIDPAGAAQCTPCKCDLKGASCGAPSLACFGSATCGGQATDWTSSVDDGNCDMPTNLLPSNSTTLACELRGTAPSTPGTCTASGGTFTNPASFGTQVDLCGAAIPGGGGCTAGNVCAPKSAPPYGTTVCIQGNGAQSCPAGWGTAYTTYTNANDTRNCTQCMCGGPTVTCTGGSYTFYDVDGCQADGGPGTSSPVEITNTTCTDVSAQLDDGTWSVKETPPVLSGSCAPPSGGSPIGSVAPTGQATYCCQ